MTKNIEKGYTKQEYDCIKKYWEDFKEDVIYNNRFFPNNNIIEILDKLKSIDDPERKLNDSLMVGLIGSLTLYRARIGNFKDKEDEEMLAPPAKITKQGRCNSDGISYLYLASNYETAIYEVRPCKGDIVTVAEIEIDDKHIFSFNTQKDAGSYLRSNPIKNSDLEALIDIIVEDLSKVVTPSNLLEYVPFQFLASYVKKREYDGFVYKSSLTNGCNYVYFEFKNAKVVNKTTYEINNLEYKINEI